MPQESLRYKTILLDKALPYLLLLLGALLRLKVLIENRSIFIDEANLARNLSERTIGGFFEKLEYGQHAPPLFMLESKMVTQILGNYEWALRLTPFVAGLGTLWILWELLREWIQSPIVRLYGLSLFCFSIFGIQYSTEFKQYSSDAFLALAYISIAWHDRAMPFRGWQIIKWMLLGGIGLWYSMPLVFVLSGVGLFFLWKERKQDWVYLSPVFLGWLLSFAAYYFLVLQHSIGTTHLEQHFELYFFNVTSLSEEAWANNFKLITELFRNVSDKSAVSIGFTILMFLFGIYHLAKNNKLKGLFLIVPILLMFVASIFHYYNLMGRLTVFALPLITLTICICLDRLWMSSHKWIKGIVGILIIFGMVNKKGLDFFTEKMTFEEIKPCLVILSEQSKDQDFLYIDHEAAPAFYYYLNNYENPFQVKGTIKLGQWDESPPTALRSDGNNTWVLFSHASDTKINSYLDQMSVSAEEKICQSPTVQLIRLNR